MREKYGLVYQIDANISSYSDTGIFSILFGTDPQNLEKAFKIIDKELNLLKTKELGGDQLKTVKDQLKGQLAMAEEGKQGYMLMMAKSILDTGKVEPLADIFTEIDAINSSVLLSLANEMFDDKELSRLVYK